MKHALRIIAATIAVVGATGLAQAQGSMGTPQGDASPTGGSNNGMSSSKTSPTANTGNGADTGSATGTRAAKGSMMSKKSTKHPMKATGATKPSPSASAAVPGQMGNGN